MAFKSPQDETYYILREMQLGSQGIVTGSGYNQMTLPAKPYTPVHPQSRVSPPPAPIYCPASSNDHSRVRNFAVPGIKKPLSGFQKWLRSFFAGLGLLFILAMFYEGYGHDRFIEGASSIGTIGLAGVFLFWAIRQFLRGVKKFFKTKVGYFIYVAGCGVFIIYLAVFLYKNIS